MRTLAICPVGGNVAVISPNAAWRKLTVVGQTCERESYRSMSEFATLI
jgi:hypothetical protein